MYTNMIMYKTKMLFLMVTVWLDLLELLLASKKPCDCCVDLLMMQCQTMMWSGIMILW